MTARKTRGEVFTPLDLINEMLDKLPNEVWYDANLKWLEPSAGNGRFVKAVYDRLMLTIKDEKHILENMLYMVELDADNCETIRNTYDAQYKLNLFEGSFIKHKEFEKVPFDMKFDIIFGNPPFQYNKNKKSYTIWHLFIKRSYEELITEAGYLLFIHPSAWRDISGTTRFIYDYIKEHNLIYLSMNDYKKAGKVFGIGSNYDYYLVQNVKTRNNITLINDIDNNEYEVDLNVWDFIPSGNFSQIKLLLSKNKSNLINLLRDSSSYHTQNKLLADDDGIELIYERSKYGSDKKNMKKVEILYNSGLYDIRHPFMKNNNNDGFIFPCVYTISQGKGVSVWYSNINKGHFGIPKVIWTNGRGSPIIDDEGIYGLTEFAYGIVDEKKNLQKIKDAMISNDFINLMRYVIFKKNNKYNYKIIRLFKKDFYKYFII